MFLIFFLISFQLDVEGHFRSRGKLLGNISLVRLEGLDPVFTYLDSRMLIKSSLGTEDIRLNARVDLLDNVVWGFNVRGASDSPLAETVSFNDIIGQDVPPVKIKRLYIQGMTKFGLFVMGFVPSHWGLGMAMNSGDGIWDDFGDTFARIMFATKPLGQNLITAVFFNKAVEGAVTEEGASDVLDADTDDLGVAVLYDRDRFKGGAYTTFRTQYASDSRALFISLYSEGDLGNIYFAEEIAGMFGSFSPYRDQVIKVDSIGAVFRIGYRTDRLFPVFEVGYASPPGDDEFDFDTNRRGREFKGFAFDPNYRPSLILFQFVGGKKVHQPWQKGYTNVLESRRVWSAVYGKLSSTLKTSDFVITPSFIYAWDSRTKSPLGFEPNLEVRNYLLKERRASGESDLECSFFMSVKLGYLFATEALRDMERPAERGVSLANPFALIVLAAYEF